MNRFITTVFCLSLLSIPAQAQQREFTPGLNYTTLSKPKKPEPAAPAEAPEASAETTIQETTEEDPATRVWNKYKALATGTAAEEENADNEALKKPETPQVAQPEKPAKPTMNAAQEAPKPSGIGAILEEWKTNKENRRDMKSKSFSVPKSLQQKTDKES